MKLPFSLILTFSQREKGLSPLSPWEKAEGEGRLELSLVHFLNKRISAFMGSLGLRGYQGAGAEKLGFDVFIQEVRDSGWYAANLLIQRHLLAERPICSSKFDKRSVAKPVNN